jgi:hypothetical protein
MKGSRMADEYEQAEETELSYEEALTLKEEIRKRGERGRLEDPSSLPGRWHVILKMNSTQARDFLNATPVTPPGEAIVTNRPDGNVDIYLWWRS